DIANRQSADDVIAKLRLDLRACKSAPVQTVFEKLADLTIGYMTNVVVDPQVHPAARVNAVLAIGEGNSPKAAKGLLSPGLSKHPFACGVAAMTGLLHMAEQSGGGVVAQPEIAQTVVPKMVAIVKYVKAPKNDQYDGIAWMRGQAADLLADLKSPGASGEVPA